MVVVPEEKNPLEINSRKSVEFAEGIVPEHATFNLQNCFKRHISRQKHAKSRLQTVCAGRHSELVEKAFHFCFLRLIYVYHHQGLTLELCWERSR